MIVAKLVYPLSGGYAILAFLVWLIVLVDVILLGIWLWRRSKR